MMLNYIDKIEGEKRMNELGSEGTPFLFIVDYKLNKILILSEEDIQKEGIRYELHPETTPSNVIDENYHFTIHPISYSSFQTAFNIVHSALKFGNSFLCNLTAATPIETNLSLEALYNMASAKYKLLIPNYFTCFSPETFITIDADGILKSNPMKGTIDANLPNAESYLLNNKKELYEHHTIVDLIRNDVGIVAEKVWVSKFRYIEKIEKHDGNAILQMSSEICGQLSDDWKNKIGTILFQMLPAGSISGAPKKKTLEIIDAAEFHTYNGMERGFYTGVFGYFDGSTVDSAVMIRFIENSNGKLYFKSGGGITFLSNAADEYQELIQKIYIPKS